MRSSEALTPRQIAFARYYAVTGNATKSAIAAGYKNGRGIWKTAWRLSTDAAICREVERIREREFHKLRNQLTDRVNQTILAGLATGRGTRSVDKALRLASRIGLFDYWNSVQKEIAEIEERFRKPLEEILAAVCEAEVQANWMDYKAEHHRTAPM